MLPSKFRENSALIYRHCYTLSHLTTAYNRASRAFPSGWIEFTLSTERHSVSVERARRPHIAARQQLTVGAVRHSSGFGLRRPSSTAAVTRRVGRIPNVWPTAARLRPSEIDAPSVRDTTPVVRVTISPGYRLSTTSEPIVTIRPGPSPAATDTSAITGGTQSDRPEVKGLSTLVIGSSKQPQS